MRTCRNFGGRAKLASFLATKAPRCLLSVTAARSFITTPVLCNRAPKCLKCSGSHLTADCKNSTKSPAECANCGGPHPANFSGYPSNPINRKQQKNKPNKNIWTEKAKERTQKSTPRQQKPSYASVTAQNTSKTTHLTPTRSCNKWVK
ncbi:nucleic-acid-binding protein from transposon X-element [Trichonephila clavipes]|uniref:Nucleic-acid-binding protein from transposon X-element n=1 Tax=Trichonephila clavipes TaxID=2585209 RepID=A0A8X6VR23_TRICX|nr:nucleic-acid-binding protein from transposon X-element [Trichonephila clavipes]